MLSHLNDILLWLLWAVLGVCLISPVMMLGTAYEASNLDSYHYRGKYMLAKRMLLKRVRWYGTIASISLLALGIFIYWL